MVAGQQNADVFSDVVAIAVIGSLNLSESVVADVAGAGRILTEDQMTTRIERREFFDDRF